MLQKHHKLEDKENCAYPERDNCNYDEAGLERCPYMKCRSMGNWYCKFKKGDKK